MTPSIDRMNLMYNLRGTSEEDPNKRVESEWNQQEKRFQEEVQKVFSYLQGKETEVSEKLQGVVEQLEGKEQEVLQELLRKKDLLQGLVSDGRNEQKCLLTSRQELKQLFDLKKNDYKEACRQLDSLRGVVRKIEEQRTPAEIFIEKFGARASKHIAGIPLAEKHKSK